MFDFGLTVPWFTESRNGCDWGNNKNAGVTCVGLVSYPEGVEILLLLRCQTKVKHQPSVKPSCPNGHSVLKMFYFTCTLQLLKRYFLENTGAV